MPQLTTKTEANQQATIKQTKPTLATQLAVRNEQIENTQTFDPTKQFVNTSSVPQTRTQTDTVRSREINNQQNAENQVLGRDKRKRRSIDSDPEFASIHTIMIAAARAAAQAESNQQDIGPQKGLEVSGVEVANFAREVVKEMANRGLPLNLTIMQAALGQALESVPRLNNEMAENELLTALGKEVEKASEVEARIRADIKERVIAPIFRAVPDPFDPRHQELLQQQLALVPEVAPEINAKQLKSLVESVYNSALQEQTEQILNEQDTEKRAALLSSVGSIRVVPYFMLQQRAPWLFKNPETAAGILQLKQESIATDLEVTAARLVKGQDGAAFDQTWRQLSAEAELTYSDVFTKEFRNILDLRRGKVWESAERKVRLETEVERTLIELLDTNNLLDNSYQTRKAALSEKFQAQGQAEQFARIIQRIETAYIEKAVTAAARDPFNTEHSFGLTILQGTREQFAGAFPHLAGTSLDSTITTAQRRAGVNMAFEGVNIAGLKNLSADNLSPILAAQEAQAYLLLPGLRSDSMFKYNLRAELEARLANERAIARTALSLLRSGEQDPVTAARAIDPDLADGIIEKHRELTRQLNEITKIVDSFELASQKMTIPQRETQLAQLKINLEKHFPELAMYQDLFQATITSAITVRRTKEEVDLNTNRPGLPSIHARVQSFTKAAYLGGTNESQLIASLEGLTPYGVELFRKQLRTQKGYSTPEAILEGEFNNDGTDGIYKNIAKALLDADRVTAGELLVVGAWRLGKEEVERFIADSTPEHREEVAMRIKQNYHVTTLGDKMWAAAAGDQAAYRRYMLAFEADAASRQAYALRQNIDSRDASNIATQIRTLSAVDASAERLKQAIISGDRERIIDSITKISPAHRSMMDQIFRGQLGQRLAQVLPNDPSLSAIAQRLGVTTEPGTLPLDNQNFEITQLVPAVESKFSQTFNRDWRAVAQDTEDPKLRMAAAGDEISLALAEFRETVGSYELGLLGESGLQSAEASRIINTLATVADRGQMAQFKAAFEREYQEGLDSFIKGRLYISTNSKEWLNRGHNKVFADLALKVVSGEQLSVADKLGIGLVLGGYSKSDVSALTSSIPPSEVVSATKELAARIKESGYNIRTVNIAGLSERLNAAVTPEAQRQAAADLLFALYEFKYDSSLADNEKLTAKHAFRGQADTIEQIRRLREIAEYNRNRVEGDNSFNWNPLKGFGAPSVAINSLASSDEQLLVDASFAAETAASLQKRFDLSEAETRAFEVHSRLGSKESLTTEEEREARKADELMRGYTARLAAMSPEELALLRTAQSRIDATSGAYFTMRSAANSIVTGVGEVAAVAAITVYSGGTLTSILIASSGSSFGIRYVVSNSVLGDDYTSDMLLSDVKHAAIMGVSQGGAAATMTFFRGLAARGLTAAGNQLPPVGQVLQATKRAEEVVLSVGAKAAQLQASAAAAAGRQAAAMANSVNASGGAVANLVTQSLKSGLEWGAIGGTAGGIHSVLNNSTNPNFWREHGLIEGLKQLAAQAGENAVTSAIISGKLGFTMPATVLVSRSVWGLRDKINGKIQEAKSEIWETLTNGKMPETRPAAQSVAPTKAKPKDPIDWDKSFAKMEQSLSKEPLPARYETNPPNSGGSSSVKAPEPVKPSPPKDSNRISAEKQDATALKPDKDGGDVAVMDRPAAKSKEGVDPNKPKIEPQKLDDQEFFWGETGGEMRPVSKPAVEPAPTARPKPSTGNVVQSSQPTIKPQNLDDQLVILDESGAVAVRPMTQPSVKPASTPAAEPTVTPSVQPQPALSPSVSTSAPGMKPSLSDMTASAVGAESALFESTAPKSGTDTKPNIGQAPQIEPRPQPAQQPGPRTATKTSNKKDDDRSGFFPGLADEQTPGKPLVNVRGTSPNFEPGRIGELALDPYNPQAPQMSTLERIELENNQREKKTKVITHYTRRRRRADGTEYEGDFDIVSENNEELDANGNPLKNGSRVVTGDRIVTVQIGTTVTRSED